MSATDTCSNNNIPVIYRFMAYQTSDTSQKLFLQEMEWHKNCSIIGDHIGMLLDRKANNKEVQVCKWNVIHRVNIPI